MSVSPRYGEFIPVLDFGLSVESVNRETSINYGRDNGVFVPQEYSTVWREFNARSSLVPLHNLKHEDRRLLLQVPGELDPKVMKLAKDLASEGPHVNRFTSKLSKYFATDGFRYTLEPGDKSATLDGFLFQGKAGYCEHYSSAAATLARLAGIPARVVAGFLGGAWEQSSLTLFVRDLDAHAWVELWDDQAQAWTRYDPVESIAPERVSMGSEYYLRSIGASIPDVLSLREKLWMTSFFIELDNFLAGLSTDVTSSAAQSIIDHGEELALLGAFGLTISYIFLLMRRHRLQTARPEIKVMKELESFLRRRNLERSPGEPVYSWLLRLSSQSTKQSPELASAAHQELLTFAEVHARFCYGKQPNPEDLKQLTALLAQIKRKI
jgi:transglutaminase-like putative cysteine protease